MTNKNGKCGYLPTMKLKLIVTLSVLLGAAGLAVGATNDTATLLQRGLFEEEANHQLDAAIGDYKGAIEQFDHERQLAATAIFRLGECYRKLGRTNEANTQYERIVREFPDQPQLAQLSRAYLPSGGGTATPSAAETGLPPDEEKFLREIQESVQTSPDLVNQELLDAVQKGYVSAAEFLLAHGADVNTPWSVNQATPIIEAAKRGNEAMVQLLLSHGAAINSQDRNRNTALSMAADLSYLAVCRTLIDHGADVNLNEPIVLAARKGNEGIVQLLLSHGADVKIPGYKGQTPLFQAVENGSIPVCQTLVTHGADVNAKDADGLTPLHVAVEHDHPLAAEFLITNKAQIDAKANSGETPLLFAIARKNATTAKLLLDRHADANLEASVGPRTGWWLRPLAWAIYVNNSDMVKVLLEGHADPNAVIASRPSEMTMTMTPDWWWMRGQLGLNAADWIQNWAPPIRGETPLLWALRGHPPMSDNIVKLLLEHGANPNTADADGDLPLMYAINRGDVEAAQSLVDHGANPNAGDIGGKTLLMHAIAHKHLELVQLLTAHGADLNALDKQGIPPLGYLNPPFSETGSQIRELLIKAGADPDYTRRRGIWLSDDKGLPKFELYHCPTNSINHYTLLEFLATLYQIRAVGGPVGIEQGTYAHQDDIVPFPDFARVAIHRLEGRRAEVLNVNVADIFQSGDCTKNVALRPGDTVEIPKEEHKVADKWWGLSKADVTALNKCLARTVQIAWQGHTNDLVLVPWFADAVRTQSFNLGQSRVIRDMSTDWLAEAFKGRTPDSIVRSLSLNDVVRDDRVLLNTWNLSKVVLVRGNAKMTFDLTSTPLPDVLLEKGDVIEVPELRDAAPGTEAKETSNASGLH
jgi:ankyrin repeat protein